MREPAKMIGCGLRRFGDDRHVEAAPDDLGNVSERHAFFGDAVIAGIGGAIFKREPIKMSRIEPVHRRPTVEPVAHTGRNALLTRDGDKDRNEAVIAVAVNGWRQADHRRAYSAGRHRSRSFFRSCARMRGGTNSRHAFFGQKATWRKDADPGRHDQAAIGASERRAKSFDGMPIRLTVRLEF